MRDTIYGKKAANANRSDFAVVGCILLFGITGADQDAGGFPNIEFNPYTSVEGTLYCITEEELKILDQHVGYPKVGINVSVGPLQFVP